MPDPEPKVDGNQPSEIIQFHAHISWRVIKLSWQAARTENTTRSVQMSFNTFKLCAYPLWGLCAVLAVTSTCASSQEQEDNPKPVRPDILNPIDITHRTVSRGLDGAAEWIDAFFDDERFIAEDATTRLRLSQRAFLEQGDNVKFKSGASISFRFPKFKNKLRLFIAGEEADDREASEALLNPEDENRDEGAIGAQYFAKVSDKRNLSLTAGVKLESREFFAGPRYRHTLDFGTFKLRFVQRVRWFTKKKWEATTRLDYERLLSEKLFFRHTIDGRWREEDDGYRYSITPALIQRLGSKKAVEYQLINLFRTSPRHRFDESIARIRLRQRIFRKWLFLETNPQVAFRNDDDFKPKAGISVRLEVIFGGKKKKEDRSRH